jgi:ubiquinone/menaquinone biosynthesis C-methylase UbiE
MSNNQHRGPDDETIDTPNSFEDGPAYEQFMGRWSRSVGEVFLRWLAAPPHLQWLDVGCGTGAFTELICGRYAPKMVFASDPSEAQIEYATRQSTARRAAFHVADAQALPFADSKFNVVTAALVINFIPDRLMALAEMRRVLRAGGTVAGYVWDFAAELSPGWPLRQAMREVGVDAPYVPGTQDTTTGALHRLFQLAKFECIETKIIDVTQSFTSFEEYWKAQSSSYGPTTKIINAMDGAARARLTEVARTILPLGENGKIQYRARANAIKAVVRPEPTRRWPTWLP